MNNDSIEIDVSKCMDRGLIESLFILKIIQYDECSMITSHNDLYMHSSMSCISLSPFDRINDISTHRLADIIS